jgi:hypothetical protein
MLSRESYRSSGRVDWGRLAVGFVLSLPLALLAGGGLWAAYRGGFYVWFFIPLIAGALASGTGWLAVATGRCRNRWVGAAVGLLTGLVALVSYYQLDLALGAGPGSLYRLDLLPGYVRHRIETDQVHRILRTPPDPGQPAAQAGPRPPAGFGWFTFVFETLCVLGIPVALAWSRASRPFSEEDGRWLHEQLFYVEPEDAHEMALALDEGDAEALAEFARRIPLQAVSRRGEVRLYYLPHKADTPVYLTLRIVDTRPWSHGWPRKLATRVRLTADEALALAEKLRPPGAGFGALNVLPVPDEPRRAAPAAAIEDLPPDAAARVLNRRVLTALLVLGLVPLELALLLAVGLGVGVGLHWTDLGGGAKAGAAAAALAGLVAGFVLTARYGDGLMMGIRRRWLAAAIRQRPGALVEPDDPDAVYVVVVPRQNWGKVMLENCQDVGLLKTDPGRRELLFEGVRQRWRIPADSIESCELEEYSVGPPGPNNTNVFLLAVLRVGRDGGTWEAPLRPTQTTLLAPTAEAKRQRCRQLRKRIRKELLGGPAEEPLDR